MYRLIFLSFFVLGVSACCTKKHCEDAQHISAIYLQDFVTIDSVVIFPNLHLVMQPYPKYVVTDFTDLGNGEKLMYSPNELGLDSQFKLVVYPQGKEYVISEFRVQNKECNRCFLNSDTYNNLESYKVNGVLVNGSKVEINN